MRIITLPECDSTNEYLRRLVSQTDWLAAGTTVRAVNQTKGRGQRGNKWISEPGMNLTFSMLLRPGSIPPSAHFLVSEAVALAVAKFIGLLVRDHNSEVEIKWPNDILLDGKKVAGILIENTLDCHGDILWSVTGIGININQTLFTPDMGDATSVAAVTGEYYDLDELMQRLAYIIKDHVDKVAPILIASKHDPGIENDIETLYHVLLWRREGWHKWRDAATGEIFEAAIEKVEPSGHLVLHERGTGVRRYLFKEVFPAF